ncbi:hypothetical protein [Terricaulis silvestris]|uniref:Uncharacterized protein n=1 Tax=Terricaulis silvestris TaxID=2686094 RepID=A0A6I6MW10_9CAUL|nr:hypothetical protein [Terricaulis silvestris]QGZ95343.1 hypothetical protein DSM104635_02192 [Terricaulis silvestris]
MRGRFLPYAAIALLAVTIAVGGGITAVWLGARLGAPVFFTVVLLLLCGELIASTRLNRSWTLRVVIAVALTLVQIPTTFGGATMFASALFGTADSQLPAWLNNAQMMSMQMLIIGLWNVVSHFLVWRFLPTKAPA